jgi:hypothetical protein
VRLGPASRNRWTGMPGANRVVACAERGVFHLTRGAPTGQNRIAERRGTVRPAAGGGSFRAGERLYEESARRGPRDRFLTAGTFPRNRQARFGADLAASRCRSAQGAPVDSNLVEDWNGR